MVLICKLLCAQMSYDLIVSALAIKLHINVTQVIWGGLQIRIEFLVTNLVTTALCELTSF